MASPSGVARGRGSQGERQADRQMSRRVFYELPIHPAMMRINGQLSHFCIVLLQKGCVTCCVTCCVQVLSSLEFEYSGVMFVSCVGFLC